MPVDDAAWDGGPSDDESDIPQFLARIAAGDEDAARELLTRYEAEVRLVVRRQLPPRPVRPALSGRSA